MTRLATLLVTLVVPLAASAQTWTPQTSGTSSELSDVFFLDASTGFAVADAGLLLSTTDGGSTWSSQILLAGALDLEGVAFNPSGTVGLIVTDDGPVFRSTDQGVTWTLVSTGAGDLRDLAWAGETAVWVAGRDGDSALSTDAGQTWAYHNTGSAERTESIAAVSAAEAWIGNREGELRHTTDGGATWTPQTSGTTRDLNDIQMLDAQTGYIAASGDEVLKTTNGGATWTNVSNGNAGGDGLFFLDVNTGWTVGDAGAIWFTNDGGTTWTQQPSGVTAAFNAVHFPTSEEGWAVGEAGTIVHFTMVTTATAPQDAPTGFHLEPAYPNPFNPSTRLRFSLDAPGPVRLTVHDALGREAALLVDAALPAGAHEAVFDAGRLPSGLYLARLTAGAQMQTRTLTLLR